MPVAPGWKKPYLEEAGADLSILGLEDRKEHLPSRSLGRPAAESICGQSVHASGSHPGDEPTGHLDQKNTKEIMDLFCKFEQNI